MHFNTPASTWTSSPSLWPTVTFDLQNLIRWSERASEYSMQVSLFQAVRSCMWYILKTRSVQINERTNRRTARRHNAFANCRVKKGKGFPYSLLSIGTEADPGVHAVSPQVIHPAVGCHYFSPGLRLPSQPHSFTAPWPVPSYTAWWQRHINMNNLPKVATQLFPWEGFEPTTCWSQVQRHRTTTVGYMSHCRWLLPWFRSKDNLKFLFKKVVPAILVCVPWPRSTFAHATVICTFLTTFRRNDYEGESLMHTQTDHVCPLLWQQCLTRDTSLQCAAVLRAENQSERPPVHTHTYCSLSVQNNDKPSVD